VTDTSGPAATGPCVLVVDDDPVTLDLIENLLSHEGYEVLRESSAESALAAVVTHTPRAAIVDLMLPGMDGVHLIQSLESRVPVTAAILITGYHHHPRLEAARRLGVRTVLAKSARLETVLRAVREVCR
jgi:DNA-binding NarL/FixJ family response regulator